MLFSILSVLLVTLFSALTFGSYVAEDSFVIASIQAAIAIVITSTLAAPFVCPKSQLPFWAPFSTTAAYSLVIRGGDNDFFFTLLLLPLYILNDDVALSNSDRPILAFVLHAGQQWMPLLVGTVAGTLFTAGYRLKGCRSEG